MALIVEDGSVVEGAESYVTVAEFKAYCDARGISYAALTPDTKIEQLARKAFDYMLQEFRGRWKGYRKDANQIGDWPRSFVYLEPFVHGAVGTYPFLVDEDTIPREIKSGQIELMIRAEDNDLMPDLERAETSVTVGPVSVQFERGSSESPRYEAVNALFMPYLADGRGGSLTSIVRRG